MMDDMDLPNGFTCGDCANWRKCAAFIKSIEPTSTTCDWSPSRFALNPAKYIACRAEISNLDARVYDLRVEVERLTRELEKLTPGGSEFSANPDRCVTWVRERLAMTGHLAAENNRLTAELKRMTELAFSECSRADAAEAENVRLTAERDAADYLLAEGDAHSPEDFE